MKPDVLVDKTLEVSKLKTLADILTPEFLAELNKAGLDVDLDSLTYHIEAA